MRYKSISYQEIDCWSDDDHGAAFLAFLGSCQKMTAKDGSAASGDESGHRLALLEIGRKALDLGSDASPEIARRFFEDSFRPYKLVTDTGDGLVTGYYEPELMGSLQYSKRYCVPVYRRPPDLVNLVDETRRADRNTGFSHMRRTNSGLVPYPTREEIETGALDGQSLELLYLENRVDAYFMHVQGSGRIQLEDGSVVRVSYDGKNGYPYTSIGKYMIDKGLLAREDVTMQSIRDWLLCHSDGARQVLWQNKSFIFFKALAESQSKLGPVGAQDVVLTAERSLAVDASIHMLGTPIWVMAPGLKVKSETGFRQLLIAQDVGSAIRGPERGDIFWGTGDLAGEIAGKTAHCANFYVLLPAGLEP